MLKKLIPDLHVKSVYDIDLVALKKRGVKGIITDLDNTLVEWDRPVATPKLVDWVNQLQELGFKVIIVSNNNKNRVSAFAHPLGIPYIHRAKKPTLSSFKEALNQMQTQINETVVIGDQLFTDILGGNRLGFYTILVVPVAHNDGFITKFNRMMERAVLSWLRKKGMIPWEE
ncbi:YqeG family HAD IIIA-type phosphatase [Microaerobacter geothermalis]|uniref:YqeG family HAD IIIA-type phosphatase n=1 Tax=Microaerobacter geothermalis TaxID=674972 RepID=UPI001F3A5D0D|nr:YqeG family HAD IIIA-type phosphatase [Microaerobacter geothermalis]MCF6092908.1 YqeG family HAD IIIA-type phosphatase [Microaerobacter geothermalis]